MGGKQIDLQQQADGEGRGAVQQRTAEQIAEARRTQRTGENMRQRTLGNKRFRAAESGFRVVDGQVMTADFA